MRILSTESLARICGQRPWLTIGIWLLALILSVVLIALFLGDAMTSDIEFSNNPDSQQAETLLEERMHQEFQANEIIIIRSETLSVDDQAFQSLVELIQIEIAGLGSDVIDSVINYYLTGEESLVSSDRHTTIMPIVMAGSWDEAIENIGQVTEIVQNHKGQEAFHILITGDASLHEDWMEAAQSDLETAEIIGIPIALFILVLVFGAIAAAFVPLILGIISIVIAVGMVALIGQVNDFSVFIVNMIAAMGFALGIDYSLFIVSRYREERAKGRDKMDAIVASAATASRTASGSKARPAALRPMRPLPRVAACRAIASARPAGQPGNISRIAAANSPWKRPSSWVRRTRPCSLRRARTSASERHCCSASAIASGSARMPWRS